MCSDYCVSVLMDKDGKYVTIRKYLKELKLCIVDRQPGNVEPLVKIQTREVEEKKQMAFVFERDRHSYLPKVEHGKLKIEKVAVVDSEKLADNFWFEKENVGNQHYCLRSVVEPKYLNAIQSVVILSEKNDTKVKDEYVELFSRPTSSVTA